MAKAVAENLSVVPIPGANAALSALISSGLSTLSFTFYGFLPRQKKDRKAALEAIQYHKETMIFYEAPHRLKETLRDAQQILGSSRKVVLGTRSDEEVRRICKRNFGRSCGLGRERRNPWRICLGN